MARLRVFVSSTYYDLKHIRSSLQLMIESMGHEAILFERGDITFNPDEPIDESCYAEMATADIAVLVIGGRYGSEVSETKKKKIESKEGKQKKLDKLREFDSITRREHAKALDRSIPVYTFIDKNVYGEYHTFLANGSNIKMKFAYAESANVFSFIQSIEDLGQNNLIHSFEKVYDIESFLKEQWSGFFRDLLKKRQSTTEVRTLAAEVGRLKDVSKTLETYLKEVLQSVKPNEAAAIIDVETKRREIEDQINPFSYPILTVIIDLFQIFSSDSLTYIMDAKNANELAEFLYSKGNSAGSDLSRKRLAVDFVRAYRDEINEIRSQLGVPELRD